MRKKGLSIKIGKKKKTFNSAKTKTTRTQKLTLKKKKKCCRTEEDTDANMAHTHCMMGT
jgi:hypothetical protein